jgi:hypothetical protein
VAKRNGPDSIAEALERIDRVVRVPVALPRLPDGTRLDDHPLDIRRHDHSAHLGLKLPSGRELRIVYGLARFDGCPPTLRSTRIHAHPALVSPSQGAIIWPARRPKIQGTYGVYVTGVPLHRVKRIALSLDAAVDALPPTVDPVGC